MIITNFQCESNNILNGRSKIFPINRNTYTYALFIEKLERSIFHIHVASKKWRNRWTNKSILEVGNKI